MNSVSSDSLRLVAPDPAAGCGSQPVRDLSQAKMTRLLVISDTPHYIRHGRVVGWEPRVRESGYLAAALGQVTILAPLYRGAASPIAVPYTSDQISLQPVRPLGGTGLGPKAHGLAALPGYVRAIRRAIIEADLVHVRCPSVIGLAACLSWAWIAGSRAGASICRTGGRISRNLGRTHSRDVGWNVASSAVPWSSMAAGPVNPDTCTPSCSPA